MEYLEIFADAAIFIFWNFANVFVLLAIFDGSRRIFKKSYSKSSIAMIVFGFIYCLSFSAISYYVAFTLEDLGKENPSISKFEELPKDWGADLPPEERVKKSKLVSSYYFKETGKLTDNFNIEGNFETYCPTESDLSLREKYFNTSCRLDNVVAQKKDSGLYWLLSGIIAMFFGYVAASKKLGSQFGFSS